MRRVLIKIGSSVLTNPEVGLNEKFFYDLAEDVSYLIDKDLEIVIVSSGAIAAGIEKLRHNEKPITIPQKQAIAAIGQTNLIWMYEKVFGKYNLKVAQILLTHDDLSNRKRYLNARNTISTLLYYNVIPIINENDTVVVEEIKFGDNDNLSAMVANLIDIDLLIILTDIDGLYDKDPRAFRDAKLIKIIGDIDKEIDIENIASKKPNYYGSGGMYSKIDAAKKTSFYGVPTIIANGKKDKIIGRLFDLEEVGTLILPKKKRISSRKHWIAFTLKPKGILIIDDGAKKAITMEGKSLLPSGIVDVKGNFNIGDSVSCIDSKKVEFARGLVNYDNYEIVKIMGLKTKDIEKILGYKYFDEVIHRDDLVLLRR